MQRTGPSRNFREAQQAFSLVELLVVMGIIAILLSLLFPMMKEMRKQAQMTVCQSNLHEIGVATVTYAADHDGNLPYVGAAHNLDQFSYVMYGFHGWSDLNHWQNLGLLQRDGYLPYHSEVFHCPLQQILNFSHTAGKIPYTHKGGNTEVRMHPDHAKLTGGWVCGRSSYLRRIHDQAENSDRASTRLSSWRETRALYADVFLSPSSVLASHGDSVNVLYAGMQVKRKALNPIRPLLSGVTSFGRANNNKMKAIWRTLDEHGEVALATP